LQKTKGTRASPSHAFQEAATVYPIVIKILFNVFRHFLLLLPDRIQEYRWSGVLLSLVLTKRIGEYSRLMKEIVSGNKKAANRVLEEMGS
jgi:hypothetical protein